jgi:hypothetical protein
VAYEPSEGWALRSTDVADALLDERRELTELGNHIALATRT